MKNTLETDIIPHQTVTAIVENVDLARAEVAQAFELLITAKKRLAATLGDGSNYYHHIFKDHITDHNLEKDAKDSAARITRNAWQYILDQTGLNKFMTEKRRNELYSQIERGELPPLTVENIHGTLQGLAGKVNGLLEESIREIFDWLRPSHDWGVGALKTNKRFSVGPKVVIGWAVERGYGRHGGFQFQYRSEARFNSLANTFSLLDGKGVQKYPSDYLTKCKEAMHEGAHSFENEYFICKFYMNGNMHIQFKRMDLLAELNRIGGGEGLPGKDMQTKREEAKTAVVMA